MRISTACLRYSSSSGERSAKIPSLLAGEGRYSARQITDETTRKKMVGIDAANAVSGISSSLGERGGGQPKGPASTSRCERDVLWHPKPSLRDHQCCYYCTSKQAAEFCVEAASDESIRAERRIKRDAPRRQYPKA